MVNKQGRLCLEREKQFAVENTTGFIEPGKKKPLKNRMITIRGLGIPAVKWAWWRVWTVASRTRACRSAMRRRSRSWPGAINAEDPSKSRFGRAYTAILGEMG